MELRLGVEIESAGIAAERASARSCAIGAALKRSSRPPPRESRRSTRPRFHRAIADATGNPEFPRFLQFIGRHLIPRRTVSGLPERMGGQKPTSL